MTATPAQALFDQPQSPTAQHMIELLRAHYLAPRRAPAGIFAPEIEAPGGRRRADLIWMGCTSAAGRDLVGHEVKVTRQDLLAELADPSKSDPWQRYCDRWWLVVSDRGIVAGVDLPATWGVMLPPSGRSRRSMTVLTPAPRLQPDDQAPALSTLARWLHWRLDTARNDLTQRDRTIQTLQDRHQRLREQLDLQDSPGAPHTGGAHEVVAEIVRRLGGVRMDGRVDSFASHVSVDDVVAALTDHGRLHAEARQVGLRAAGTAQEMRQLLARIDLDALTKLEQHAAALTRGGEDR